MPGGFLYVTFGSVLTYRNRGANLEVIGLNAGKQTTHHYVGVTRETSQKIEEPDSGS